jgi:hypothetical protein
MCWSTMTRRKLIFLLSINHAMEIHFYQSSRHTCTRNAFSLR